MTQLTPAQRQARNGRRRFLARRFRVQRRGSDRINTTHNTAERAWYSISTIRKAYGKREAGEYVVIDRRAGSEVPRPAQGMLW